MVTKINQVNGAGYKRGKTLEYLRLHVQVIQEKIIFWQAEDKSNDKLLKRF